MAAVVLIAFGACAPSPSSGPPATGGSTSPGSTPSTSSSGGPAGSTADWAVGPRPTPPSLAELCRRTLFMNPDGGPRLTDQERRSLRIVLEHQDRGALYLIFSTGTRDATCIAQSVMGFPSLNVFLWSALFPSRVTPERPLAADISGFDSELDVQLRWGAVGPAVARVTISSDAGPSVDAVIQGGYLLALLHGAISGRITLVAYDAAGRELART